MLGERDILGSQLVRRNDELALLYEKVKIQQSTLSRGQLQYRDRCARVRSHPALAVHVFARHHARASASAHTDCRCAHSDAQAG